MSAQRIDLADGNALRALHYKRSREGGRVDALEALPYHRARFLKQRRAGHELRFTEYGDLLRHAMKPVRLPTPLSRFDAEVRRDTFAAIERTAEFNRMVMAPFAQLLGRAA